jgi:hypothetical protein
MLQLCQIDYTFLLGFLQYKTQEVFSRIDLGATEVFSLLLKSFLELLKLSLVFIFG